VKAAAYAQAAGGPSSNESTLLGYIDRFGAQNVLGRPLGLGEIRRMIITENIIAWYSEMENAANWIAYSQEHPGRFALLEEARELAEEEGLL
jgi:hypothetical protein